MWAETGAGAGRSWAALCTRCVVRRQDRSAAYLIVSQRSNVDDFLANHVRLKNQLQNILRHPHTLIIDMQTEGEQWRQLDHLQRQLDLVNAERLMVEVAIYATTVALASSEVATIGSTADIEPLCHTTHDHLAPRPYPTTD